MEKKQLSQLVLAIGYAGGAVLLLLLLFKDNADELTARVAYTAASAIVLGLVAAAGVRLLERPEPVSLWGWMTLLIAVTTFLLILVEIWRDSWLLAETRVAVMVVISILLGGGSLTLSAAPGDYSPAVQRARGVAILGLVALGTLTVLAAVEVDIGPRWFGVASLVFLVSALSLPFLPSIQLPTGRNDEPA
ncbi:MAG TPA: hypothetical protein VK480_07595 [Solirubrobacterales bacterium]|nr:hypothetical protein [Solirubrobacterales bacterium]